MHYIDELIDDLMQGLQSEAQELVNEYWEQKTRENEHRPADDRSYLGCRALMKGGAPRIEWFKLKPVKRRDGSHRTYTEHIKKGRKGLRYPDHALKKHARVWQFEMVRDCEDRFAELRESITALVEMRRQARVLRQKRGLHFVGEVQNQEHQPAEKEAS